MLLLATLAHAAPLTQPAADDEPHWTVTVDPLTEALGFVHVQVERSLGQRFSLYAGPSLKLFNSPLGIGVGEFKGYGVEAGLRVFAWGRAPRGAWIMARGVLADVVYEHSFATSDYEDVTQHLSMLGGYASALVGYTGIIPVGHGGLTLSGGLGISYFDYGPADGIHGFLPAAHTTIGWAF